MAELLALTASNKLDDIAKETKDPSIRSPEQATFIVDEQKEVRACQLLPSLKVEVATDSFFRATVSRTKNSALSVNFSYPKEYPQTNLIVDIIIKPLQSPASGTFIPPLLKKKLQNDVAEILARSKGQPQLKTALIFLQDFANENKFFPLWKEVKQSVVRAREICPESKVLLNDRSGIIKLIITYDLYELKATIHIDDAYPFWSGTNLPCNLKVTSTNFPPVIERMITAQAIEVVRRCAQGMSADEALISSNPIKAPKGWKHVASDRVVLSKDTIRSLHNDTKTLKKVQELRNINDAKQAHNQKVSLNSANERRQARRDISKLTAKEIEADEAMEEKVRNLEVEQAKLKAGYVDYEFADPQLSLLPLVNFLCSSLKSLCETDCPICAKKILVGDPTELANLYKVSTSTLGEGASKEAKRAEKEKRKLRGMRPIRVFCGCYYHYKCLDVLMTEPPFGKACAGSCFGDRPVHHPDYPDDKKILERAYSNKNAREREIADAAMCF